MNYRLTKSKFILGLQCEKALYLDVFRPELAYFPPETLARFRKGRSFESIVKASFKGGIDISQQCRKNIKRYPELTAELICNSPEITLFEAGFVYNEVLILADVVRKDSDGNISVFEIKNSLSVKDIFRRDVAIQYYVINNCINHIVSFSVIYNDGNDMPLKEELLPYARETEPLIAKQVERFKEVIQGIEPVVVLGEHCNSPYDCPYRRYCEGRKNTQLELSGF